MVTYEPTVEQDCSRGPRHFRQVSTASVLVQKPGKQVAPLRPGNLAFRKAGSCREEAVRQVRARLGKSLAFDPVLSADFPFLEQQPIFIIRHSLCPLNSPFTQMKTLRLKRLSNIPKRAAHITGMYKV